ncbi:ADP-ribosylglycohydrolase family protein [Undibacterium sp. JH2W]|uniref:ADP-ribosylglycohydrolase family protein n=1 Tax=Undibacterium sp. JH2W TaxID=3413037 RepID=UPI003BF012CE
MLLEIAIGDAYGAGFEFCPREKIVLGNTLEQYVPHGLGIAAGHYTDDTQMSIAVAEVLLADSDYSGNAFADAYVRCYKRDQRQGYARGLQGLLDLCRDGADLRERISPESRRNGAAMRSVPLGLIADKNLLAQAAREQAMVTHNTVEGILSSHVVALMSHALLYDKARLAELPDLILKITGFVLRDDWHDEVECDALQTLHAVNTALQANRCMSTLLLDCVNFGGDVDSVAAIAMGLASLAPEYVVDIPGSLLSGLELGQFGSSYLRQLDVALAQRYPVLGLQLQRQP